MSKCICCPNFTHATSIVTANGITTITVPATFNPTICNCYCVLLRTTFPTVSACNSVVITNGTVTWPVLESCGSNWRPCNLKCRSILKLRFCADPDHFILERVRR